MALFLCRFSNLTILWLNFSTSNYQILFKDKISNLWTPHSPLDLFQQWLAMKSFWVNSVSPLQQNKILSISQLHSFPSLIHSLIITIYPSNIAAILCCEEMSLSNYGDLCSNFFRIAHWITQSTKSRKSYQKILSKKQM